MKNKTKNNNQKLQPSSVLRRYCLCSLHLGVLLTSLPLKSVGFCAGWLLQQHPSLHPYMKVWTAIPIDHSQCVWWGKHWFNTLGGCPADPTVCESFVGPEQTRPFWILTYKGSFSRASRYEGRHSAGQTSPVLSQHTEGISLTASPSVKSLFSSPQSDFPIDWRDV